MTDKDRVLIAGAGPVGLSAALFLASREIPATVLEAESDLVPELRASTFHPPTLDMLDQYGVTERVIAMGLIAPTWQIRDRATGVVGEFDLGLLKGETAHPYRVQCEQFKLTRILLEKLAEFPDIDVVFAARVRSVDQADDHVVVTADTASGPQAYRGAYLIGADGAPSAVRKSVDIEFEGFTFPEHFLVLSTPFDFAMHFPGLATINYITDAEAWFVLLRVPEFWRALFPVAAEAGEEALLA